MSWIKRLGGRLPDFEDVVRRFPVPVGIMAIFTVWIIADNHFGLASYSYKEFVYSGFILSGYVAVIVKLIVEARKGSNALGTIMGLGLAILAFFLCYLSKTINFTAAMAIGAAILFLGNAAAWRSEREDRNVWNFTQKLWTGALFATVGSVIFLLGMLAISEAVKALFGVNLNDLTMETILPIGLAFLAPIYWLGTLPRYGEAEDVTELSFEARALSFLGTWMLAPLVIVYALIILAYGVKILVQWDLPKGEIAQLVSPFLGVGMLVWLMLEPKVLNESGFVRFYRAAWHWVMLPAAILLGIAVFVRIGEYGFTGQRVLLTLVVIWAIVQSIWFTVLPKVKRDIRFPTAIAAGLLLIGALFSEPVSTSNQFQRAYSAKAKLENFQSALIEKHPDEARRFIGGLRYLIKKGDGKRFSRLLPDMEMPNGLYDTKYDALIEKLGLSELTDESHNSYVSHIIVPNSSTEISGAGELYGNFKISMLEESKLRDDEDILSNISQLKADLSIGGEFYPVDFETILQDKIMEKSDRFGTQIRIPPIELTSKTGQEATLMFVGGYTNHFGGKHHDASFELMLFVPN